MGIVIGPIEFEGPYMDAVNLKEEAGLYAILCENKGEFELVELDESSSVKNCFDIDEYTSNMRFWQETSHSNLLAVVHYTPDLSIDQRRDMKKQLLEEFE
ncbi:MAG: hypothetical protein K2X81_15870 [Candidatus Obscuribacterales bacterium]|nr:hypothetical protein [Candidatus Obscuribacterales bacterium]